jgi:NADH-quinone oxidoreductase subunit N
VPIPHIVPQLALVVGAAIVLVGALVLAHDRQRWLAPVAIGALVVSIATQVDLLLAGTQQITFEGVWALDGIAGWATVAMCLAAVLVVGMAPEWMRTDPRHGEYYTMVLLGTLGASVMAGAADAIELIIGIVLAGLVGYVLAAYHRGSPASTEAGMKLFLIGGLTNGLLLLGVVLLYGVAGTTVYRDVAVGGADTAVLVAVLGLVGVGIAFELGAFPAHAWMPDVAQGAPAPSAAFVTVIPKLGALVALARFVSLFPPEAVGWRPLAAVLAAATMTIGNLSALWQDDVRRILGWSSVSQSGYGLMALVALGRSDLALPALLFFLFAYSVANLAAFGVVVELRGRTALADYAGLVRRRPWLAVALTVALLSLVGIPPLAGFSAKLQLFAATIDADYGWLAVVAVVNTVVSLFYYLRIVAPMVLASPPRRVPVLGSWAGVATGAAAALVVALGVGAEWLLTLFEEAVLLP